MKYRIKDDLSSSADACLGCSAAGSLCKLFHTKSTGKKTPFLFKVRQFHCGNMKAFI